MCSSSDATWVETRDLTDAEWFRIAVALGGKTGARARKGGNARRFVDAVMWVARTGACWSDLPAGYGNWRTTYVRFLRWMRYGQWPVVVNALDEGVTKESMYRMVKMNADRDAVRDVRKQARAGIVRDPPRWKHRPDEVGHVTHSVVVVQTHNDAEADITIIVHSTDDHLAEALHGICSHAVRHATRSFDKLTMDAEDERMLDVAMKVRRSPEDAVMEF